MSATEELRTLLDERGADWRIEFDGATEWESAAGDYSSAVDVGDGKLVFTGCLTPEQAIAATLGTSNETAKVLIDDMLDFIGNCCETTLDCDCCDPVDCKYINGCGELAECTRYQDFLRRAKAIAAALGDDGYKQAADYWKGMYEELLTERIGEERDYPEHDGRYECPDCGNVVYYDELYGGGWTIYVEDYQIPFNHCPKCGKAVKR